MSRYCDNCKQTKSNTLGREIKSQDKLTYKWICKDCQDKRKTRYDIKRQKVIEPND